MLEHIEVCDRCGKEKPYKNGNITFQKFQVIIGKSYSKNEATYGKEHLCGGCVAEFQNIMHCYNTITKKDLSEC